MQPTPLAAPDFHDQLDRILAFVETPAVAPGRDTLAVTVAAFTGLGYALSARALLMLALLGTFVLALRADDTRGLMVLVAWGALTILPTTVLEIRKGRAQ